MVHFGIVLAVPGLCSLSVQVCARFPRSVLAVRPGLCSLSPVCARCPPPRSSPINGGGRCCHMSVMKLHVAASPSPACGGRPGWGTASTDRGKRAQTWTDSEHRPGIASTIPKCTNSVRSFRLANPECLHKQPDNRVYFAALLHHQTKRVFTASRIITQLTQLPTRNKRGGIMFR